MEVPIINRISDLDVGISDPSFISRAFAVSDVGKLHQAYSFWKWGALLLLALFASFTSLITRIKSLVLRLRNVNVSLPSPTFLCDYDSDSDWSSSSDDGDDEDEGEDDEDYSVPIRRRVSGDLRVGDDDKGINGNIRWMRRCSGSFGDLLDLGSSGVVNLWEHLDINGEGRHGNVVASFFNGEGRHGNVVASSLLSPAVLFEAEKKGSDAVEVSAWDARTEFGMPALLAEWRQPGGYSGR